MRARGVVLAFAFLFLAGALGGAARPATAQDLSGAYGGDVRVALQGFTSTSPLLAGLGDKPVLELIYDQLGRIDPVTLEVTPWAATGWVWDNDRNITVTLRDDLAWSDGTPYDADDVAYSFGRYTRGPTTRWNVTVVDAHTVKFDFWQGGSFNTTTWNYETSIKAGPGLFWTEALSASIAWAQGSTTLRSSGPYAVQSYVPGSQLALVANEHHFKGRPFLDSITYLWPYTVDLNPVTGNTTATDAGCALMFRDVHLIGWPLLTNDLTNTRDCGVNWGGFPAGRRESLLSTDQNRTVRHVLAAKNPGNDFLYFGFAQNGGSLFVGAPGTDAAKLRDAIYRFVNKVNYRDIEPNSAGSHSVVNRLDTPWAPVNCPPWTPCSVIVDAGFVGTGTAKKTDSGPGVLALTLGGLLDRDGDGIRETSASVPISFRILAPSFTLDPRKTTISGDMEFLLRGAGLDVTTSVYNSWTDLNNAIAGCTDSCMYIQRYRDATTLPDWLMGMPEIRAANDPQVDLHLNLGGGSSFSQGTRALHTGHVFHLLSVGANVLPVLHFDSLEAFDFESFEGWMNVYGGINNFWSLTGLRLPDLGPLSVRLSIFPTRTLGPGGTTDVQVEVRDENGIPVAGVDVALSAGMGTLTAPAGTTDGSGIFRTEYTAPATIAEDADVMVDAVVMKDQYQGAMASEPLTLHEPASAELRVTVVRGAPEIDSGNTTTITVEVLDAGGAPVSGATVALRTDLPGATITPASGTTGATGEFQATFTADVRQEMRYQVVADVSKVGYADDLGSASLVVRPEVVEVPRIDVPKNVPGFEAASAVGAVAVVFVLVALARRRRED